MPSWYFAGPERRMGPGLLSVVPASWSPLVSLAPALKFYVKSDTRTLSGTDVTSWTDQAGGVPLGPNSVGGGAPAWADFPQYSATSFNGRPGVTFSGAPSCYLSQALLGCTTLGGTSSTFFMIAQMANLTTSARLMTLNTAGSSDFAAADGILPFARDGANQAISWFQNSVGGTAAAITYDTPSVFLLTCDNSFGRMYINNSLAQTDALTFTLASALNIALGQGKGANSPASMIVAEAGALTGVMSSGDRASLQTYANTTYGV